MRWTLNEDLILFFYEERFIDNIEEDFLLNRQKTVSVAAFAKEPVDNAN